MCGEQFARKTRKYIHTKTCLSYKREQCDVRCNTKRDWRSTSRTLIANVSHATSALRKSPHS